MLHVITSVPAVAGVALATAILFVRDMLEGEKLRPTGMRPGLPHGSGSDAQDSPEAADVQVASRVRYRSYGIVCAVILVVLVVLRFVTLAG